MSTRWRRLGTMLGPQDNTAAEVAMKQSIPKPDLRELSMAEVPAVVWNFLEGLCAKMYRVGLNPVKLRVESMPGDVPVVFYEDRASFLSLGFARIPLPPKQHNLISFSAGPGACFHVPEQLRVLDREAVLRRISDAELNAFVRELSQVCGREIPLIWE
jgi:hypothetical protein